MSFLELAPSANPVFYRTYSRKVEGKRESFLESMTRFHKGLVETGFLTQEETDLLYEQIQNLACLPSGRWMWVGGTDWVKNPENYSGAYNCSSTNVDSWSAFGHIMDLAMQGCGTGAVLESHFINQLPVIKNKIKIFINKLPGELPRNAEVDEETKLIPSFNTNNFFLFVGDSRKGWVDSYVQLLRLSTNEAIHTEEINVRVNLANVRPSGAPLKGFGGVANPSKLPELFTKCADILNGAVGRQLTSVECALLINEAALVVVAGNIRRSANIQQGGKNDLLFANAKDNLWQQDEHGNWSIDPKRDALRMANLTRVFHSKPTLEECIESVRKQFYSGEGAIQYANEAIIRGSADLLPFESDKLELRHQLDNGRGENWFAACHPNMEKKEVKHRLQRYGLNPCLTADTWVHTGSGARQIKELIGKPQSLYVNGELFDTTEQGFFFSGHKPVVKLYTHEGYTIRLTENHQLLRMTKQPRKKHSSDQVMLEWVETSNLKSGDHILLHDHKGLQAWSGNGTSEEGWLIGSLIGEGCFSSPSQVHLCFQGSTQLEMKEYALKLATGLKLYPTQDVFNRQNKYYHIVSSPLIAALAKQYGVTNENKTITDKIEKASYQFYCGFLRGLFDTNGRVTKANKNGTNIVLSQKNESFLKAVQRMLLRLGIASVFWRGTVVNRKYKMPHELIISKSNLKVFQQVIGFTDSQKRERLTMFMSKYARGLNNELFAVSISEIVPDGVEDVYDCTVPEAARFDANGFVAHNCGEIILNNNHCNLAEVHLNNVDPHDFIAQEDAFKAGALSVAALLHHQFPIERYQYSREVDPIVGVSFTGLFDFFVSLFGIEWLRWWEAGRPEQYRLDLKTSAGEVVTNAAIFYKKQEQQYLTYWKSIVNNAVWDYCDRHNLKRPNRCTTVQPAGTKSLLTNASPGWHPPKSQRFIRRITFSKNDPVALACLDYGFSVIPSQSDRDEHGNLLNNPFDERCTEWLVEIPTQVPWADLEGADKIDIGKFSALAQFDFYMQVQQHYTTHNTSATIEFTQQEIEPLGKRIYEAIKKDEGYISAALLARFESHQTFPRLPFEPISKTFYDELQQGVLSRRKSDDFLSLLNKYDNQLTDVSQMGPAGCDSDKCLLPTNINHEKNHI